MTSVVTRHCGGDVSPRAQRLQRERELVVLGHRQGVVDVPGRARDQRAAGLARPRAARTRGTRDAVPVRTNTCALAAADDALVAGELVALQLAEQTRARPRRRTGRRPPSGPGRPPSAPDAASRNSGVMVESASITSDDVARRRHSGSSRASTWLSAPAFCWVLATVSTTSTPCSRAIRTVASVQLSATTITRSGGRVWRRSDARVRPSTASSSCAGISTVQRSGSRAASARGGIAEAGQSAAPRAAAAASAPGPGPAGAPSRSRRARARGARARGPAPASRWPSRAPPCPTRKAASARPMPSTTAGRGAWSCTSTGSTARGLDRPLRGVRDDRGCPLARAQAASARHQDATARATQPSRDARRCQLIGATSTHRPRPAASPGGAGRRPRGPPHRRGDRRRPTAGVAEPREPENSGDGRR